jgi:hypothetical protein
MRGFLRLLVVLFALFSITTVVAAVLYRDIPNSNTDLTHFDTLIVWAIRRMRMVRLLLSNVSEQWRGFVSSRQALLLT